VIPEGFEPSTYALEVRCSIQLSYGTFTLKFLRIEIKTLYIKQKNHSIEWFFVIAEGFEPSTACLEGRCSIQLSYATIISIVVGVAGFEPAASCSQSRRDNRATLHPEAKFKRRDRDSNPGDGYPSTD
jgi:hypothetical protein